MSRQAIKSINWAALAERIPESEKHMLAAFKAKSDQYLRRMVANPETTPKLDWAYYKKNIPITSLVDKFQKEYEAFKVPYPADTYTNLIESEQKKLDVKIQEFIEMCKKQTVQNSAEIERIKGLLPYAEMTMEDFAEAHPDIALDTVNRPTFWPHDEDTQKYDAPDENHH